MRLLLTMRTAGLVPLASVCSSAGFCMCVPSADSDGLRAGAGLVLLATLAASDFESSAAARSAVFSTGCVVVQDVVDTTGGCEGIVGTGAGGMLVAGVAGVLDGVICGG